MGKANTFLVVGDIHLKQKNLPRAEKVLNEIGKVIRTVKPSLGTILLGDVFDNHGILHLPCLRLYTEFINEYSKPTLIHVLGNHEMVNSVQYLPRDNALVPFEHHRLASSEMGELPCYVPITQPREIYFGPIAGLLGFIPFIPPKTEFHNIFPLFKKCSLVFCHQEFEGAVFNSKAEQSEIGDSVPDSYIISGHIHFNQTIGKVWYPGTPVQSNFGESVENKAVYVIEVDESKQPPFTVVDTIPLAVPRFVTHRLSIKQVKTAFTFIENDDMERFIIEGTRSELLAFKPTEQFQTLSLLGKVKFVVKEEEKPVKDKKETKSFQELLKEYAAKENLTDVYSTVFN